MADHRFISQHEDHPGAAAPDRGPIDRHRATHGAARLGGGGSTIVLRRWADPVVDRRGHDPRSRYVERFWLGVLGPSATWLLRRLTEELNTRAAPTVKVDLVAMAQSMGMTYAPGRSSPFAKAIQRCVMFDVAHHTGDGLAVRSRLPNVAERHLRRLPPSLGWEHDRWVASSTHASPDDRRRATRLAIVMAEAGDAADQIESQLVAIGVTDGVAAHAAAACRCPDDAA